MYGSLPPSRRMFDDMNPFDRAKFMIKISDGEFTLTKYYTSIGKISSDELKDPNAKLYAIHLEPLDPKEVLLLRQDNTYDEQKSKDRDEYERLRKKYGWD